MSDVLLPSAAVRNFAHRGCRCDSVGGNVSFYADPVAAIRNIRRAMKPSGLLLTEPRAKQ
jgi:hypothetical protein